MIFLFFGTSLALLEAELAPFKDWEDIGDICSSGANKGRRSVPVLHCASLFVINVAIILNIIVFILILSSVDEQDIEVHNMFMTILLKAHSGEKLHKCNQCDFASSQSSSLRTHLKTHSGEKSNKCNQCDYAPIQAGDLRTHLKTHRGEKTNKCSQ